MQKKQYLLLAVLVGLTGYLLIKREAFHEPSKLPVYSKIQTMQFSDQSGNKFGLDGLKGKVSVAHFFFSRCQGPCPLMTQKMARLQKELSGLSDFRSLSITVDPTHDKPAVLMNYGKKYHADFHRWFFLTGPIEDVVSLSRETFHLAASEDPELHSTRFILIDRQLQVRGYYDSQDKKAIERLIKHTRELATEAVPAV